MYVERNRKEKERTNACRSSFLSWSDYIGGTRCEVGRLRDTSSVT